MSSNCFHKNHFSQNRQNTKDVHTLAQLISAYSLVDTDKAKSYPFILLNTTYGHLNGFVFFTNWNIFGFSNNICEKYQIYSDFSSFNLRICYFSLWETNVFVLGSQRENKKDKNTFFSSFSTKLGILLTK